MRRSRQPVVLVIVLLLVALVACAGHQAAAVTDGGAPTQTRPAPPVRSTTPGLEVNYLANEGFLVRNGDDRVLVDALFGDGVVGYQTVPTDLREMLELGTASHGAVRVALASHFHADHFDPKSVGRFLEANPQAVFISTPQAAESFRRANPGMANLEQRFLAVLPEPGTVETLEFEGIRVDALNLHHGRRDPPVENLGFVVTLGQLRFIHFGDTEAKMEDFEPYMELLAQPDLALLPFWFLSSEWRAEMVRSLIRPESIAVAHLPRPDAPPGHFARWRNYGELRATIEKAFPDAWIPSRPGEAAKELIAAVPPSVP